MSKKKKKMVFNWEDALYPPLSTAKEGDLRFKKTIVEKAKTNWLGENTYKTLSESPQILERYDGKTWNAIPLDVKYITV